MVLLAVMAISTVYPRVCGGTGSPARPGRGQAGLSPRVRGNRHQDRPAADRRGSIPACAGEPNVGQQLRAERRVYPRVCGGTAGSVVPGSNVMVYPRVCGGTSSL